MHVTIVSLRGPVTALLAAVIGAAVGWCATDGSGGPGLALLTGAALVAGLVWAMRPVAVPAPTPVVLAVAAAVAGAAISDRSVEGAVLGTVTALAVAVVAAVPAGVGAAMRQRAAHRRQGWELARAVAAEEEARVDGAVARERAAMAGEIHDRLGHRLTLIAVRLGGLTLDPDVPARCRSAIEEIRAEAADAAAELGETVQLLRTGNTREPVDRPLREVVEGARRSGLDVTATLPADLDERLGPHARAAMERVLTEALTNAARHAPGSVIAVEADVRDGVANLAVRNTVPPAGAASTASTASSGYGLASLRHRLEILGGRLDAGGEGEGAREFVLRARVPADAVPSSMPDPAREIVHRERASDRLSRRTRRLAWTVPTALAGTATALAAAYFAYANTASVLPPDEFSKIRTGMDRAEAEDLLPSIEMLEAPREVPPPRPGETCRFYEASVSFFVRDDVYRVCFGGGTVTTADFIPAP